MAYEFFHCDLDTKHEFKHLCASSVLKFKPIINHQLCCLVAQSFPTLCDLMDCSRQVSSVLHYLLKFAQIHVHGVGDAIKPSHPLSPPSPPVQSFPASGSFPVSPLFTSGCQRIGASASATVPPVNIQG